MEFGQFSPKVEFLPIDSVLHALRESFCFSPLRNTFEYPPLFSTRLPFEGSEAELSVITHIFDARDMTGVELLDLLL
jgi:hypothetical protein